MYEKRREISDVVMEDLQRTGRFYSTALDVYYFDDRTHRLLSCGDASNVEFRTYINDRFGINGSEPDWRFVFEDILTAAVQHGEKTTVHRFCHYDPDEGKHYVYKGGHEVFLTTERGSRVVPNGTDGVLFEDGGVIPIEPARGRCAGAFDRVLNSPNFRGGRVLTADHERALYRLWAWGLFFPTLQPTRPLLLLEGVKGSTKTSSLRLLLIALLGEQANVLTISRDAKGEEGLTAALTSNHVLVIDNVDGRIGWLGNLLAVAATGAEVTRRKLYTTNEEVKYPVNCFIAATSRQPDSFERDDVVDRLMILGTDRRHRFKAERTLVEQVVKERPRIWADILSTLPKMIRALRKHRPTSSAVRLADFYDLALAIGPVLGIPRKMVDEIFDRWEAEKAEFLLENSTLLLALTYWAQRKKTLKQIGKSGASTNEKISTGEFYKEMMKAWPDQTTLPFKSSRSFGKQLKNQRLELSRYFNIKLERGRANQTMVSIAPKPELLHLKPSRQGK